VRVCAVDDAKALCVRQKLMHACVMRLYLSHLSSAVFGTQPSVYAINSLSNFFPRSNVAIGTEFCIRQRLVHMFVMRIYLSHLSYVVFGTQPSVYDRNLCMRLLSALLI
jgi:hypothetical protein